MPEINSWVGQIKGIHKNGAQENDKTRTCSITGNVFKGLGTGPRNAVRADASAFQKRKKEKKDVTGLEGSNTCSN